MLERFLACFSHAPELEDGTPRVTWVFPGDPVINQLEASVLHPCFYKVMKAIQDGCIDENGLGEPGFLDKRIEHRCHLGFECKQEVCLLMRSRKMHDAILFLA